MYNILVTREVSQLETSALKLFSSWVNQLELWKSWSMLVMAETSQPAIGPYFAVAALGSAMNARTAVRRSALVVKVPGG